MSFRGLLDHRVDVVRPSEPSTADSLGDERPVYAAVSENVRCAFWPVLAPIGDYGAGETPQGATGASFERTTTIAARDIIVTLSGPEHPTRWRVVAKRSPGRRRSGKAHHIEVEVVPHSVMDLVGYDSAIPDAGS